jgi:branched-chain amino acid transport system substrate-binding protein
VKEEAMSIPKIILALLLCGACSGTAPADERVRRAAHGDGDLVIAAAWPWQRRADIHYGEGLDMAVAEVNAAGGINGRRLRLDRHDDAESHDEGAIVAQRIAANPDVVAVIGHLQSYVTVPAAPIYEHAGLVLIAPTATDPQLTTHGYHRVFRATVTDQDTGRQLADYAKRRFHRVGICYIRNTYGRGLANAFEERANEIGLTVAARRSYELGDEIGARAFEPIIREWRSLELDAIFLAGEVPSAALFVAQARAAGLGVPIIGGDAMGAPTLMTIAGGAAEGMVVASFFHPDDPRVEVQQFGAAFRAKFSFGPDAGSALGYDAVHLLARAMKRAGSAAPDDVARALKEMPVWAGVTGPFEFDKQGGAVGKRLVLTQVHGGRFIHLDWGAALSTSEPAPR